MAQQFKHRSQKVSLGLVKNKISISSLNKLLKPSDPIIINSDVTDTLKKLPRSSIDVIVTSPPYWDQRNYKSKKEFGKESTPQEYVNSLSQVNGLLKTVLKDKGVYFLNIGDKYKNKNLEMIPERVALQMQDDGWTIRNKIIWRKTNPNPCPVKDRFANGYEIIYMCVKSSNNYLTPDYFFNLDNVRVTHKTKEAARNTHLPRTIEIKDYKKYTSKIKNKIYNGKFKGQDRKNIGASAGGRVSIYGEYYSLQRKHFISEEDKININNVLRVARKKHNMSIGEVDLKFNTTDTAGHWFRSDKGGRSLPKPKDWNKLKKILNITTTKYDKIMTEQHYVLQTVSTT